MSRKSAPYWKASHRAWYCTINGTRHRLGAEKAAADREFHRLMLASGEGIGPGKVRYRVAELIDVYLDQIQDDVSAATLKSYRDLLGYFAQSHGSKAMEDLRPIHVTTWLRSKTTWGANTRALVTNVLKIWSRWCRRSGMITIDPLADMRSQGIGRRPRPAKGDLEKLLAAFRGPEIRTLAEIAIATGCRPGELRSLTAAQVDLANRRMVVVGKMGPRVVMIPSSILETIERLCLSRPDGPILRNPNGGAWTAKALSGQFARARERSGVTSVVPYTTRGHFATEALRAGVDSLLVAKMLGHSNPMMLLKHYADPDDSMMLDAVEQATKRKRGA